MPCSPRMRRCRSSCRHRLMVELYREAREAWERRRDEWAVGYATERAEYAERTGDTAPNLKDWLQSWAVATASSYDEELAS